MRTGKRLIANGNEYNHLFREVSGRTEVRKKFAGLSDTIDLMKEVTFTTLDDTRKLAQLLKKETQKASCEAIWNFCFKHLQYQKDQTGKEQVRSPARTWRDRTKGIDCDCMSVFIGSVLTNLGIPYSIRLTRYKAMDFEHVYPVAHTDQGTIIMDCVVHQFNYEVPYTQKKDIKMELQYLNGFEDGEFDEFGNQYPEFSELPYGDIDLEGLEGRAERKARRENKPPLKERAKNVLHKINRVNPASALLRAGVLASMKLNLMNVAAKLRFAYWTEQKALQNNVEPAKFQQLKAIHAKIEKVFYGAGGKPENLKEAILKGKGNKDNKVALNGLGWIDTTVSDADSLKTILGNDLYYDELLEVQKSGQINGLGEAVSATASIAAASGIVATIAGLLKKIGSIFRKGSAQGQEEILSDNTAVQEEKKRLFSMSNIAKRLTSARQPGQSETLPATITDEEEESLTDLELTDDEIPQTTTKSMDTKSETNDTSTGGGAMQWIKDHPLLSAGIAATIIAGTVWAVKSYQSSKKTSKKGLNGIEGFKKKKPVKVTKTPVRKTKRKIKPPAKGRLTIRRVELL